MNPEDSPSNAPLTPEQRAALEAVLKQIDPTWSGGKPSLRAGVSLPPRKDGRSWEEVFDVAWKHVQGAPLPDDPAVKAFLERWDELHARMQTPESRAGVEALLRASGQELGQAALEGVRRDQQNSLPSARPED